MRTAAALVLLAGAIWGGPGDPPDLIVVNAKVTTLDSAASAKNGIFSRTSGHHDRAGAATRPSGQKSSSSSVSGKVTSIGFAINPSAKRASISAKRIRRFAAGDCGATHAT